MKYCTKCLLPETHETIEFDHEGFAIFVEIMNSKRKRLIGARKEKIFSILFRNIGVNMPMIALFLSVAEKIAHILYTS